MDTLNPSKGKSYLTAQSGIRHKMLALLMPAFTSACDLSFPYSNRLSETQADSTSDTLVDTLNVSDASDSGSYDSASSDTYDASPDVGDTSIRDTNTSDTTDDRPDITDTVIIRPDTSSTTLSCDAMNISRTDMRIGDQATLQAFVTNNIPSDAPLSYFFINLPTSGTTSVRTAYNTYTFTAQVMGMYNLQSWVTSPNGRRADCPSRNITVRP